MVLTREAQGKGTQSRHVVVFWSGFEPATSRSPVRVLRLNESPITPQYVAWCKLNSDGMIPLNT